MLIEEEIKAIFSAMQTIRSIVLSNQVLLRFVSALGTPFRLISFIKSRTYVCYKTVDVIWGLVSPQASNPFTYHRITIRKMVFKSFLRCLQKSASIDEF